MNNIPQWLREVDVCTPQHALLARCETAANHIDGLNKQLEEKEGMICTLLIEIGELKGVPSKESLWNRVKKYILVREEINF